MLEGATQVLVHCIIQLVGDSEVALHQILKLLPFSDELLPSLRVVRVEEVTQHVSLCQDP